MDPSLRSPGIAVVSAGVLCLARSVTIGDSLRGAKRLWAIYRCLDDALRGYTQEVGGAPTIEGPSLNSSHREYDLGEGSGVLKLWLMENTGQEPWIVAPTQLKLFATGDAHATKEVVQRYVEERFAQKVDGDDASDAAVLAEISWYLGTGARPKTRAQAEVLHALKNPRPHVRRTKTRTRQV